MSKRTKKKFDGNQLTLFQDNNNVASLGTGPTTAYDAVISEIKRNRNNFTCKEEYYRSPEWQYKRRQKLDQVSRRCESCGKVGRLDIHHLNYDSLYNEDMEDLQALCRDCHGPADSAREYDSAFSTYLNKRFGDNAYMVEASDYADEFDNWLDSKQEW